MKTIKVAVIAKSDKDADYIRMLLSQGKSITICDSVLEADAIVFDAEILTNSEKEALKALVEHGSVREAAAKTLKTESTLKKQICSARKKLKAKTNLQAILIACRLGLI